MAAQLGSPIVLILLLIVIVGAIVLCVGLPTILNLHAVVPLHI